MYLGEIDDPPTFTLEDNKAHFANPVYESMYAGNTNEVVPIGTGSTAGIDEKKGLLQQDDGSAQDLL